MGDFIPSTDQEGVAAWTVYYPQSLDLASQNLSIQFFF